MIEMLLTTSGDVLMLRTKLSIVFAEDNMVVFCEN